MPPEQNTQYIECPQCGEKIQLTEALTGHLENEISQKYKNKYNELLKQKESDIRTKLKSELSEELSLEMEDMKSRLKEKDEKIRKMDEKELELRKKERELQQLSENMQAETEKIIAAEKEKMKQAAAGEFKKQMEILKEELDSKNKKLKEAEAIEKSLRVKQRELEDKEREMELELERKMDEERKKVYARASEDLEKKYVFRYREKDEMLDRYKKQVEELSRKLEQGSQQLQGEVQELELEDFLRQNFPNDIIADVPKGIRGADVIQKVRNNTGKECGTILWESKRTKNWQKEWIPKLKNDLREIKADIPVIVSQALPEGVNHIERIDGVWVIGYEATLGMATALREQLIQVHLLRSSQVGINRKMDAIYNYLCSNDFKQRIEGIVESFTTMKAELDSEKRAFERIWSKREKQLELVIKNTSGMYGDLQALIGSALPEVEKLGLLPGSGDDDEDTPELF